jgi:hypothetical protein
MTDIADALQTIDTTASQRGQHDELTSLILHAPEAAGGARMTLEASPLGSATPEVNGKRRPELVD